MSTNSVGPTQPPLWELDAAHRPKERKAFFNTLSYLEQNERGIIGNQEAAKRYFDSLVITDLSGYDRLIPLYQRLLKVREQTFPGPIDEHWITLSFEGDKVPIPKNLLTIQSSKCKQALSYTLQESTENLYDLTEEGITHDIFHQFVQYLKTGEVALSGETVLALFHLASKHFVPHLESLCIRFIKENISPESFKTACAFAQKEENKALAWVCFDFATRMAEKGDQTYKELGKTALPIFAAADRLQSAGITLCIESGKRAARVRESADAATWNLLQSLDSQLEIESLILLPAQGEMTQLDLTGKLRFLTTIDCSYLNNLRAVLAPQVTNSICTHCPALESLQAPLATATLRFNDGQTLVVSKESLERLPRLKHMVERAIDETGTAELVLNMPSTDRTKEFLRLLCQDEDIKFETAEGAIQFLALCQKYKGTTRVLPKKFDEYLIRGSQSNYTYYSRQEQKAKWFLRGKIAPESLYEIFNSTSSHWNVRELYECMAVGLKSYSHEELYAFKRFAEKNDLLTLAALCEYYVALNPQTRDFLGLDFYMGESLKIDLSLYRRDLEPYRELLHFTLNTAVPLTISLARPPENPYEIDFLKELLAGNDNITAFELPLAMQAMKQRILTLGPIYTTLPNLKELDLTEVRISPEEAAYITEWLSDCRALQFIRLSHATGVEQIASAFGKLPHMAELDLTDAQLDAEKTAILATELTACKSLKKLILSNNRFGDEGLIHLKPASQLEELELTSCKITAKGLQILATNLQEHTHLKRLILSGNPCLDVEGARHLASIIMNQKNIELLDLGYTGMTDEALKELLPALENKSELQFLNAAINKISSKEIFPKKLWPVSRIEYPKVTEVLFDDSDSDSESDSDSDYSYE